MLRFWDGYGWTEHIAPPPPEVPDGSRSESSDTAKTIVGVAAIVPCIIGLICTFQTVSLASGMGAIWIGMAIAIGGAVVALATPWTKTALKVVCLVLAALAVVNAVDVNNQMNDKRHQIEQILTR